MEPLELIMRWTGNDQPQDLAANAHTMFTGYMGDCVSVVVSFNLAGANYLDVRGYHAGGGIENTNWAALFAGVPNLATTLIDVFPGSLNGSAYRMGQIETLVQAEANARNLGNAGIRIHYANSSAQINRFGVVTMFM